MKKAKLEYIFLMIISSLILGVFTVVLFYTPNEGSVLNSNTSVFSTFLNYKPKPKEIKETPIDPSQKITQKELLEKLPQIQGTYALSIYSYDTSNSVRYNSDKTFNAASLYKMPILFTTLEQIQNGNLTLDTELTYEYSDFYGGTGTIQGHSVGNKYTVDELLNYLIRDSDNIAQNILFRNLKTEDLKRNFSIASPTPEIDEFYNINIISPEEYTNILRTYMDGNILTQSYKDLLISYMYPTSFDNRISKYLKSDITFYHKIGSYESSLHDCGYAVSTNGYAVVCLMSEGTNETNFAEASKNVASYLNSIL